MSISPVRIISQIEANALLASMNTMLDKWGRVASGDIPGITWVNFKSPENARELLVFCQTIVSWLSEGEWIVFRINDFNGFQAPEEFQLARMLLGPGASLGMEVENNILIEKNKNNSIEEVKLIVSDIIYLFLLHEGYIDIVSSGAVDGEHVGVKDGFIYFYSNDQRIREAESLMRKMMENPKITPDWVLEIVEKSQNASMK